MAHFSIIIPYHDRATREERLLRCLRSIESQTFRDFETLLFHDGPVSRPLPDLSEFSNIRVTVTDQWFNDWGHSLRDLGIRQACGDYIVHFNADNLLYPDALEELSKWWAPILIPAVKMMGLEGEIGRNLIYSEPRDYSKFVILRGIPIAIGTIDCMQLIMLRRLWLAEGGWSDRREQSDGLLYKRFTKKYPYQTIPLVMGEHW